MKRKILKKSYYFFVLLFVFLSIKNTYADEYLVTESNVDSVLNIASAGDTIIYTSGTYTNEVLTLTQSGTSSNPILFKAQTLSGVVFKGASSRIEIQGDYWIVDGFKWDSVLTTSSTAVIYFNGASNNILRNCTVHNSGRTTVGSKTGIMRMMNTSQDNIIEYNRFESLVNMGIQVWAYGTDNGNTGNTIRYNYFVNHDALEYIQLGQGGASAFVDQYSIVEHNLFQNFDMVDPELVSSKTSHNIIRHNTFRDCFSMLVLRTGESSTVEGNWFFDSQGIRVHDKNHVIINNYIEGAPSGGYSGDDEGIVLYCGNMERPNTGGSHYPADSILLANNTVINHTNQHILIGKNSSTWSYQPDAVEIKNNLVTNNVGTAIQNEASTNASWQQNMVYPTGTGSAGNVGNVINTDPDLTLSGEIYKLSSSSPAIDSAATETLVTEDIEGQSRNDLDIGADEYSSANITYSPLDSTDVGPGAGDDVTRFTLSTSVTGSGTVSLSPTGGLYDSATVVTVTATAASGYEFDSWSGDRSGSTNPLTVQMDSSISITANFTALAGTPVILTVDTVYATADDGNVPANTLDNNLSTRWSAEGDPQSITYQLDSAYIVKHLMVAWYRGDERNSYFDIAVSANGSNWETVATDTTSGSSLQQQMIDIPDTTVAYVRIIGHGNSVNSWNSITEVDIYGNSISGSGTPQYTLTTSVIGNGSITLAPSGGTYDSATVVTVTAVADSGYVFDSWSGDRSGSTNPLSVTMDSSMAVTATFIPQYTLSTSTVGSGSITLDPSGGVYDSATVVTVTAVADSGYVFDSWSGDRSGSTNPLSVTMDSSMAITATFIPQYTLSTATVGSGSISLDPSGGVYDSATVVTVTATAGTGYVFDSWSGDRTGSTNPLNITMDSNISITATFSESGGSQDTVTIEANHDAHLRGGVYGDTNYGNEDKLRLKETSANYTYRSVIQVDCSAEGLSDCASATLRIYIQYVQGSHSVTLYKMADNWDESTVTYNNAPQPGNALDTISIVNSGWYEIDVTDYVSDELAGNDTVSFYFIGGNYMNYCRSSEAGDNHPELVIITSLEKGAWVKTKIPEKFEPLQNYPNPFHDYTNISFELPSPGRVRLEVFNINGEKIETLVNKNLSQGNHKYQWNPGNNSANISGIYFYRLTTPYGQKTNKMNYVKIK